MFLKPAYMAATIVALALLALPSFAQTSETPDQTIARQNNENNQLRMNAQNQEAQLVRQGDDFMQKKNYAAAVDCYKRALSITYLRWNIRSYNGAQSPASQRESVQLNTPNTARARDQLSKMNDIIKADQAKDWKAQADAYMRNADQSLAQKQPGKAYAMYAEIVTKLDAPAKENKDLAATVQQAQKKMDDLAKIATKPLDDCDKALAAGKPTDAKARLDEFMASYADMLPANAEIKARVDKLNQDPAIVKESHEQEVRKRMALGDAALERKDYVSTMRHYRMAASMFPDTDAAKQAADKVAQMQADPTFAEGMKKQEAESQGRLLFLQAETLRTQGDTKSAGELYQKILDNYPDSSYADRAKDALATMATGAPADKAADVKPATDQGAGDKPAANNAQPPAPGAAQ